ncbi:type II toxin-antitoxin system RelE/ParE family toxin [Companilactobacillus halodurans]|uniref:Addiction module toxin RelE n=1 Tax=Companilactobacillus halodurans TaxID=2584183 RepID=A0A5P0ZMB8_9LACO|nr:type II toxin-antitoxin system RelE/ParE family toxin [Companilactobacillus halodurans]MQS75326.1 hypothetical protein [Companilactobacillus halodurans]MQS97403.1 hypothetical protein [Companilactobacillus halodurans]
MQIDFKNKRVEKQCRSLVKAKKDFPEKIAIKLLKLINFVELADNLESVINNPVYHFHKLKGDLKGLYSMDIDGRSKPYRLIVKFDGYEPDQVFHGSILIERIQIEEVSKHYE